MDNALNESHMHAQRPLIREVLQNFFLGNSNICLQLLIQALTSRIGDCQDLGQSLSALIGN